MTSHPTLRVALSVVALVLWATSVTAQDAPGAARTHTWLVTYVSVDGESAAFRARAGDRALTAAESLTEGQDVMLRWDGPNRAEAQRISAIRAIESEEDAARRPAGVGEFAMRGAFVRVNKAGRTITFSIPVGPEWLKTLEGYSDGEWLQIVSAVDCQGSATGIESIDRMAVPGSSR